LPRVIYRSQRRQYFRIEALLGTEITFRIGSSKEIEKAKVKNYSGGGVAFVIEKELKFGVGDLLNDIHLNIPEGTERVHFQIPQAVVRRIEERSPYAAGKILGAIEFTEISNETRKNIISQILRQQRTLIKRIKR
jgi:c-di-GMP-binding flagellar brake protein YcgR